MAASTLSSSGGPPFDGTPLDQLVSFGLGLGAENAGARVGLVDDRENAHPASVR